MNTHDEREQEIKALRAWISRLSAAIQRVSESPGIETVLREALEPCRQGVQQIPPPGVKQMPSYE